MTGLRARLLGAGMLALGLGVAWFFGLRPLQAAWAGAQQIEYDMKLFVASPLAIVGGLVLLIGGKPVGEAFAGPPVGRRQHMIVWPTFAAAMAAGAAAWWWFDGELHALGYVTG